jgi:hypothetical protein
MRLLQLTSRSTQVACSPTAPQGNVTAASHRYVINGKVQQKVTNRKKSGEAGQS